MAVITSAGVVYLRFWRGWRFSDMMYVTRSSLTKSISQVLPLSCCQSCVYVALGKVVLQQSPFKSNLDAWS